MLISRYRQSLSSVDLRVVSRNCLQQSESLKQQREHLSAQRKRLQEFELKRLHRLLPEKLADPSLKPIMLRKVVWSASTHKKG